MKAKKNYLYSLLFILITTLSVSCKDKERELKEPPFKKKEHKPIKLNSKQLMSMYENSKSSDTVVPFRLYVSTKSSSVEGLIDLYQTYDLNQEYFRNRIKKLFYFDHNVDRVLWQIDHNKIVARQRTRDLVLNMYQQYNSIEGADYAYLCDAKDDFAIKMAERMFSNKESSSAELKRIAHWVLTSFSDSTFVKNPRITINE